MRFDIVTIFPKMIECYLEEGVIGRAVKKGIIEVGIHNLRDFTDDKHRTTDDYGYGGNCGMVMLVQPFVKAIESLKRDNTFVVMTSPSGIVWNQEKAEEYSQKDHIIILSGRYKGIDNRILNWVDEEISIGDYVLSGGEIPSIVIMDSVSRLVEGVVGDMNNVKDDSFSIRRLSYPVYTRPPVFRGLKVPEVLLSGNHKEVDKYRKKESLRLTYMRRRDLFDKYPPNEEEKKILKEIEKEYKEVKDEHKRDH